MKHLIPAFVTLCFVLIPTNLLANTLAEKQVTFYNTYGHKVGDSWSIPMRIWVRERSDTIRRLAAKGARKIIKKRAGIEKLDPKEKQFFVERSENFIADNESRETVIFVFDNDPDKEKFKLVNEKGKYKTDRNGIISGTLKLSLEKAEKLLKAQSSSDGWLSFQAVSKDHGGSGKLRLISDTGLSIISDVDDTIKVTEIPSGEAAVLKNTFFREFKAAFCMADIYQQFPQGTAFHYVSGGPWQMYEPLEQFIFSKEAGFPLGSFHMKNVRTNPFETDSYKDIWKLIASGSKKVTYQQKINQISQLLKNFPRREFILIGDSGEKDPEVFSEIAKMFPNQIRDIRIRDVVEAKQNQPKRLENMTIISADGTC